MDPGTLLVAEQVVSTTVEGAALATIGLAQSTQPLSATFTRITSEAFLPRSSHTLTVVSGHAYIFGGKTETGELAGNEVHIVTLPLTTRTEGVPDYKCVPALGDDEVPGARFGHSASAIGKRIYIFGGRGTEDEKGRVWVFDTSSLHWTHMDPEPDRLYPPSRTHFGYAASVNPLPPGSDNKLKVLGTQIQETISKTVPSIVSKPSPPAEPHGTVFISGGLRPHGWDDLTDTWAFTIATRTWTQLPSTPAPKILSSPALTLVQDRLYLVTGSSELESEIHYLTLPKTLLSNRDSEDDDSEPPNISWTTLPFPTNPLIPGPRPRKGAGLLPITTGNGRSYLLYFLGEKASPKAASSESETPPRTFWSDAFSYQTPASSPSPAGSKDATRATLGFETGEDTWAEVKVVANEEGAGLAEVGGKSHPGPRGWFGSDVLDDGKVVLWGGIDAKGETEGDGWIVSVR